MNSDFLQNHRVHDYRHLIQRWRAVARSARLRFSPLAESDGYTVWQVASRKLAVSGAIYISAGIHGDEPAATEALITWAEANLDALANGQFLIFPCLNPWGLSHNNRLDADARDVNRLFHRNDIPFIRAIHDVVRDHRFQIVLTLHEDYDAVGFYLYEIARDQQYIGERILRAVSHEIPIDPRAKIDGHSSHSPGILRPRALLRRFEEIGYPEAAWLYFHHADRSVTCETPSEFALDQRIRAHIAAISEVVELAIC